MFLAPQNNIAFEGGTNLISCCPDFVALDYTCKHIAVVEVTAAANIGGLIQNVTERETRWFNRSAKRCCGSMSSTIPGKFVFWALCVTQNSRGPCKSSPATVTWHFFRLSEQPSTGTTILIALKTAYRAQLL